jgi:hypothetical protein
MLAHPAVEFSEFAEIGNDALADGAEYRHRNHHLERRDAAGAAGELAPVALHVAPAREAVAATEAHID